MLNRIYQLVKNWTNKKSAMVLLALVLLHVAAFAWRTSALPEGTKLLDARIFSMYDEADVRELFEQLSPDQRTLYWVTELTIDISFPIVYSGLIAMALVSLWKKEWACWLLVVVLLGFGFDLAENSLVVCMLLNESCVAVLASIASTFTFSKWTAISMNIVLIGVALIGKLLWKRL